MSGKPGLADAKTWPIGSSSTDRPPTISGGAEFSWLIRSIEEDLRKCNRQR
jgi:hypothetical protein